MSMDPLVEARVAALDQAVKFATTKPMFYGNMNMPEIIEAESSDIIKVAKKFEDYLLRQWSKEVHS